MDETDLTLALSSLEERELFVCMQKYISLLLRKGEGPGMRSARIIDILKNPSRFPGRGF